MSKNAFNLDSPKIDLIFFKTNIICLYFLAWLFWWDWFTEIWEAFKVWYADIFMHQPDSVSALLKTRFLFNPNTVKHHPLSSLSRTCQQKHFYTRVWGNKLIFSPEVSPVHVWTFAIVCTCQKPARKHTHTKACT